MPLPDDRDDARAGGQRGVAAVGLTSFVVLGVSDAMLGVAWPAMRQTFHRSLGSLGILLIAAAIGFAITAIPIGRILARLGAATALIAAAILAAVAAGAFSATPLWWGAAVAAFVLGSAGGVLDSTLNVVLAQQGRRRFLNLIHGVYGGGTVLGPLVMTAGLVALGSWRTPYGVLAAIELALAVAWMWSRSRWSPAGLAAGGDEPAGAPGGSSPPGAASRANRSLATSLGLAAFFLCAGAEATAGQWAASFLQGPIGLSAGIAGLVVSGYWASYAVVRLLLALPRSLPSATHFALFGSACAVAGSLLLWWRPTPAVAVASLVLIGAGLAPVFPAMVSLTSVRQGTSRAQHVLGWQMAAAGVGGTTLSALVGVVLQRAGLGALGIALVVLTAGLGLANVALDVRTWRTAS